MQMVGMDGEAFAFDLYDSPAVIVWNIVCVFGDCAKCTINGEMLSRNNRYLSFYPKVQE